jgi:hypothetical protein
MVMSFIKVGVMARRTVMKAVDMARRIVIKVGVMARRTGRRAAAEDSRRTKQCKAEYQQLVVVVVMRKGLERGMR